MEKSSSIRHRPQLPHIHRLDPCPAAAGERGDPQTVVPLGITAEGLAGAAVGKRLDYRAIHKDPQHQPFIRRQRARRLSEPPGLTLVADLGMLLTTRRASHLRPDRQELVERWRLVCDNYAKQYGVKIE
jgi:hypothetical protein